VYLTGIFHDKHHLIDAIQTLKRNGASDADLDIFSEEPVEFHKGILDRPSKMSLVTVVCGGVTGIGLTYGIYWAQNAYKVITGGMPYFSPWATGVISFEMTMLGAVVSTFAWFLWESGLIRRKDKAAPVPAIEPGVMYLRVRCESSQTARITDVLEHTGGLVPAAKSADDRVMA
jgi:hypothetical protein